MIRIGFSVQSASTFGCFVKYPIPAWIRRTIGYAMLDDVHVDSRAHRGRFFKLASSPDNFINRKIFRFGALVVELSDSKPHLIGDFQAICPLFKSSHLSIPQYKVIVQKPRIIVKTKSGNLGWRCKFANPDVAEADRMVVVL